MKTKFRMITLVLGVAAMVQAMEGKEAPWRFLLLADWHSAEKYTQSEKDPEGVAAASAKDVAAVRMLKENYGGELILMPGDSNSGHWDTPKFIKANFPGASAEESILRAGKLCYSGMIESFRLGGYSKLIMAVGDHEMGDNPWPAGSAVARCQPQFREAFAKEFNMNPDGGRFLYEEPIGKAASRPLGTIYEMTSYAYRHKNVLFVTVDAFHQVDPNKNIGEEGSVTGTVTGPHLEWLENVLAEARKDAGIKHILVQSHLPVIYPVRKVNSSGMMMDDGMDNPFWKTLRKHKVDLYFAGEVHANTVTKDPESDIIQLVSRGNSFSNIQTLDISDERIEVICYEQKLGTEVEEGDYSVSGRLLIDKSSGSSRIEGDGELAVLDPSARIYHFDFENTISLSENPIVGMANRTKDNPKLLRGVLCEDLLPNRGAFGKNYNAVAGNVELVSGAKGRAGQFGTKSRMGVFSMGPLHGKSAVSYALWVKTEASERQVLVNTGAVWSRGLKDFFNLNLSKGRPEVMVSDTQSLLGVGPSLNDGQWHHIAVSMPSDGCRLSEVLIYVNGNAVETQLKGADRTLRFNQAIRIGFGGLNYSNVDFDKLPVQPYVGAMDELIIWARPIDREDIEAAMSR